MKVNITEIRQGDIIKFSDRLGTHTAVAMRRAEKSRFREEYDLQITYLSTTNEEYTTVGAEGIKFFRNYKSTVNKIN